MKNIAEKVLKPAVFSEVIKNTPLVSIDLCLVFNKKLLLGLRKNKPLKNVWFTPGARILKNECWQDCLLRIAHSELGLQKVLLRDFSLMGVWDHFYDDSFFHKNISTHYVNLPHYICLDNKPHFDLDDQHKFVDWFDLEQVANSSDFHKNVRTYAYWLIEKVYKID